jgi:hypothetical protein
MDMLLSTRTALALAIVTGVALELGVGAIGGRREAWDSAAYWTLGLPAAAIAAAGIGVFSRGSAWLGTVAIVPAQVLTMMLRSGEIGGLWPLAVILSAILSTPFVVVAFVASRYRPT